MSPIWWTLLAIVILLVVVAGWLVRSRRTSAGPGLGAAALREGLTGTRRRLGAGLESVFSRAAVSDETWQGLADELIAADLGVKPSTQIVEGVRKSRPPGPDEARAAIRGEMVRILSERDRGLDLEREPSILVVVGVNGVGKTTTAAKLAALLGRAGRRPIIAAADTFRPAADTQLMVWAERVGVQVVSGRRGGDPAAVAYDALQAAKARNNDVLIVDTAGRFQTRHNLMEELAKIIRVLGRDGDQVSEVLLVLDATTGQSALPQARRFAQAGVTGMVLTKMDGTAKGGVVLAIENELDLPVKFMGVGEGLDDLVAFDPDEFVDALLGTP